MAFNQSQAVTGNNSFDDNGIRVNSSEQLTNLPLGILTVVVSKDIELYKYGTAGEPLFIKSGSYLVFCYHCDNQHQNKMFYYLGYNKIYWIEDYQGDIAALQLV